MEITVKTLEDMTITELSNMTVKDFENQEENDFSLNLEVLVNGIVSNEYELQSFVLNKEDKKLYIMLNKK